MDIRNRIADVVKLRCNACQEFLGMILIPGWQEKLYRKAELKINNNDPHKENYIPIYEEMRDIGYDNYSENNMDVTSIYLVIKFEKQIIIPVDKRIVDAFAIVKDDRNTTNHSNENEDTEELYLRALLSLVNLRSLIRAIDLYSLTVDDEIKLKYRQKYMAKIYDLKHIIDDERFEIIEKRKKIEDLIKDYQGSKDSDYEFGEMYLSTMSRWHRQEKWEELSLLHELATDAGLVDSYYGAALVQCYKLMNYSETERLLLLEANKNPCPAIDTINNQDKVKNIINLINKCKVNGYSKNDGFNQIVDIYNNSGRIIKMNDEGLYEVLQ